jgi:hypothetical protein
MHHEVALRLIKILDIGFVSSIYLLIAVVLAGKLNSYFGEFDEKKERKKTFLRRTLELIGITWLLVAIMYIIRNLVELIPSPFHGIAGFDHYRLKELKFAGIFIFILLFLQTHYRSKLIAYASDIQ